MGSDRTGPQNTEGASEEEDEEQEVDPSDLSTLTSWKQNLGRNINAIETFGDVACSKSYQNIVLPGLEVGGTPISLPLTTPRDVDVIRNACYQAPSGRRGDETVADEAVRKKTYEIGREGFRFSNPHWPNFVNALLDEASVSLSMPQGVRAELDKLVLYEPGSSFTPHMESESEKAPGTIATLAICLPSAHEGGDVHVYHSGQTNVLATSHASAFEATALAWYFDATHDVRDITSGHRVVATYNVVLDGVQITEASALGFIQQQVKLESILQHDHAHYDNATRFFYQLSNKYPRSALSLQGLKGHDRARVHALHKACVSCGYVLLLANVTKEQEEFEEKNSYLNSERYGLDFVVTCDGSLVGSGGQFDPSSFVGSKPYHRDRGSDSVDRDERNYTEPTRYMYHDSAAVIVRKDELPIFLNFKYLHKDNLAKNVAKLIATVFYNPGDPPVHNEAFEHLRQLMGFMGKPIKSNMGETLSEILSFAIKTGDLSLWNDVLGIAIVDATRTNTRSFSYGGGFNPFGGDNYGQAAPRDSWDMGSLGPVLSRLALHLDQDSIGGLEGYWDKHLSKLITSLPDMDKVEKALDRLDHALKRSDVKESLRAWRNSLASTRFNMKISNLEASDCLMIITLLQSGKGPDWVHDCLLPALKNSASKSIVLALIPALLESTGIEDNKAIARVILGDTMERLVLDASDLASTVRPGPTTDPAIPRWSTLDAASDYNNSEVARFVQLVRVCMHSGLDEESFRLLDTCCRNVAELHEGLVPPKPSPRASRDTYERYGVQEERWVDTFLADVIDILQQKGGPVPASFKPLFERLIRHYVLAGVIYPKKPVGWAHKRRECPGSTYIVGSSNRCGDSGACRELNDFLESTTQQTHHFQLVGEFRKHIESQLNPQHFRYHTIKSGAPHTLVVTKIGTEYQADVEKHMGDVQKLGRRLRPYQIPCLQEALGDELYNELVLLEKLRTPPSPRQPGMPLGYGADASAPGILAQGSGNKRPASGSLEQPVASKMRMSGLIDLTGDN